MRNFRRTTVTIALAVVMSVMSGAAGISAVEIPIDNVRPDDRTRLTRYLRGLSVGESDNPVLADSAVSFLRRLGYLDACLLPVGGTHRVNGGTRYVLEKTVDIDSANLAVTVEAPFTPEAVRSSLDKLVARVEKSGHYYASAQVERIDRSGEAITIYARLNRGPKVTIDEIKPEGLSRTSPKVVGRYLAPDRPPFLSAEELGRLEHSASQIPFLRFVPPASVKPKAGYTEADIVLSFRERKQVRLSGGIGYLPDNPAGLIWDINLALNNLWGKGQSADLISKRTGKRHQTLNLSYRRPVFWIGRGELGIRLATRDFRDQFYEFLLESAYSFDIGRSMTGNFTFGWKRVNPSDDDPDYTRTVVGVGATRRSVDNELNPRYGWAVDWKLDFAHRRYRFQPDTGPDGKKHLNETNSHLAIESYHPVAGPVIGAARIVYDGLETAERRPPNAELILLGGPGTIRGFRTEQFAALRAVCGSLEPRLRFDIGYLFGFTDIAWMQFPGEGDTESTGEQTKFGYGGGFTIVGDNRSLKLSLGWNKDAAIDQPWLSVAFLSDL